MRTIGRHFSGARHETQRECDVCGVEWYRSRMRINADGFLVCPDDYPGRTATELNLLLAEASEDVPMVKGVSREGDEL